MTFKKLSIGLALGAMLFTAILPSAQAGLSSAQRLADFTQLTNVIARHYGPLLWKKESIGLDFQKVTEAYQVKIQAAKTDAEFYRLLAGFLAQLQDAHVSPMIPSTLRATLGFVSDFVEGKVLIEAVDRLRLPEALFPFKRGDQVLEIGGLPVEQVMQDLILTSNNGHELTNLRFAAARLSNRSEGQGFKVPRGVTTLKVLQKGAAQPVTVTATWIISGSPVIDLDDLAGSLDSSAIVNAIPTAFNSESLLSELKKMPEFNVALPAGVRDDLQEAGLSDIGAAQSMFKLPANAQTLPLPVTAAIYEAAGKKIGILRIPSYPVEDGFLQVMQRALFQMQAQTDVLVLDQTNNPGGAISLASSIAALFADKSFKDVDFEVRPTLSWVKSFQDVNSTIASMLKANPNDPTANALKARFEYLESEVRTSIADRRFATNPISLNYLGDFGMIQPSTAVTYTKPVLLLINEFDFSCGDLFPAIMKDNGRAVLFGGQTAGAGGNVRQYGPLANSFFSFTLTESLMVRPNGEYLENRGVKPDIEYKITEDDFMNGYRGYTRAFTIEALKLVGVTEEQFKLDEANRAAQPAAN